MCADRRAAARLVALGATAASVLLAGAARGQVPDDASGAEVEATVDVTDPPRADGSARRAERREPEVAAHTMFIGGVGLLALPGTEVCPSAFADCEPGETGVSFALHSFGRFHDFGLGAGITYAFGLRATEVVGDADGSLGREHSRSYFLVEGHFHYYLPELGSWQTWVGASAGGVVINDSWTTKADRDPTSDTDFVGPRAVMLGTEGLAVGLGVGGYWPFAEHWVFGTHFRYANWLLPEEREQTPVGDLASLAGRIDVIDVGLSAGMRLPL